MSSIVPVYGVVYLITNLVNGKVYVGQTVQPLAYRFRQHYYDSNRETRKPLQKAIREYGRSNFSIEPLCSCSNQKELDLMEDLHIVLFDVLNPEKGYNLKRGGTHGHMSDMVRALFKEQRQGSKHPRYRHDIGDPELASLYETGKTVPELSQLFSASATTVARRLENFGITLRPYERKVSEELKQRFSQLYAGEKARDYRHDVSTDELVSLYREGQSPVQIGHLFSIHSTTVRKRLEASGIKVIRRAYNIPENSGRRRQDMSTQTLIGLYLQGLSTVTLGRMYNTSPSTIKSRLDKAGVQLRPIKGTKHNAKRISEEGSTAFQTD